ncbi:NAD-dependent succinate-semialdehyde dehydrogenase [Mesorhizobium sp. 10J20-29]
MQTITSLNPATGETLQEYSCDTDEAVNAALDAAVTAQKEWRIRSVEERTQVVRRVAEILRAGADGYGRLITLEMGKPLAEAIAEVHKCAWNCEYYADNASKFLADESAPSGASESYIGYQPLGVVLAIMPWNYPLWQFFRFAAPALAAGNGIILKHASNVPGSALACQEIMSAAGVPNGLMKALLIGADKIAGLIADDRIAAVTLTGSTEVGSIVASQAGKAIKKQVLELGGSDAFIVLADADIELAASTAVKARFINVGQSCVNAKRFIVVESVADRFVELFSEGIQKLKVGDPFATGVTIGPMARANLRETLNRQVETSVARGARLVLGGHCVEGPGCFYQPTLLDFVTPGMPAFDEETFGPAAAVIRVKDSIEAIRMANQSEFGLGAALWTQDLIKAKELARAIDAGAVFVNGMVASDPRLPFGGIKRSGYGRELGVLGIREFTNMKTVWIGPAST